MASTINGRAYQLATMSITATGNGAPIVVGGFQKLDYKMAAAKKGVPDSTGKIVGHTTPNEEPSGTLEMWRQDWDALKAQLYALNPGLGIGQITIPMVVVTYGDSIANLVTEKILGVMFNEDGRSSDASQDALKTSVPLFFTDVIDAFGRRFIEAA